MIYYYGTELSPNQIETAEGFLICKNVPIARTGMQEYTARDLMLDGDPERMIKVNRYEADVFEPAALASFEGKPVTDGHPPEEVEPANFASYAKGHIQRVRREGDFMVADLYINDPILINDVRNGIKREVSCGYICEYTVCGDGYKQSKIRGNHVAVVPRGRAGHEVAIKDESPVKGGDIMGKLTKELLKVFGAATKDASSEEIEKMAATTAAVLDAAPAETAPEAEPTATVASVSERLSASERPQGGRESQDAQDVMVERAPKGDDLGTKLDELLAMVRELAKKNDREEKMDRKLTDESDLDEMIEKLSGGEEIEKEDAVTIPAEEMEDACRNMDAVEILRRVRPAVAAIKDKNDRARVTDALISSIRGNDVEAILSATKDAAMKNANSNNPQKAVEEQQKLYNSRNPHKKDQ